MNIGFPRAIAAAVAGSLTGVAMMTFWPCGLAGAPNDRYVEKRMDMVEQLRGPRYGIKDERVLEAMEQVPRHEFVPEDEQFRAYGDHPLPIGYGQTISQPFMVAYMTEALKPEPADKVLEVGTGSGYQAAVLAPLVDHVYTIEIVEPLGKHAAEVLKRLSIDNVTVKIGDGYEGWPEHAPYDAIIVTCAPDDIPQPLIDQLREGGRMIVPVGETGSLQELYLLEKSDGKILKKGVMPVRFVPMTGQAEED